MLGLLLALAVGGPVAIHVDTTHRIQTIRPLDTMGTAVDSDPKGKISLLYSPPLTKLMLSTGLGRLTYRLYTELSIEDWHWNPAGRYSDAARREGYWTSSSDIARQPITDSFGYRLPHRGSSRDQGDDNEYSRIDDGDPNTYWKSDPYLAHRYTGQPDSAHPQWAVVQFLEPHAIDAVRVEWSNPYATDYVVQYWSGDGDAILEQEKGRWKTFPSGSIAGAKGGTNLTKLAASPISTTAVRILMSASSNTCDSHGSSDPRNCVGYAIADIGAGTVDASGSFRDQVVRSKYGSCHGQVTCRPDPKRQTLIWTSSDDPWHAESNRVRGDQDQPGLDLIARSGLARGMPTIYPVPLFYSTPENAANEIRYMEKRHYPIAYIEMGEEVDGQFALPEDYAELYIQFARAIHQVDPSIKLGGPVFSGVPKDITVWRDAHGDDSWLHRFIAYLRSRGRSSDFAFMSWEHYPYHHCDRGATLQADLLDEPSFVRRIVDQWHADGVPASTPMLETENNFSPDGTDASQNVYGALWTADFMGASLAAGVSYATYYQAEAEPLGHNEKCDSWGAYNPYIVDDGYNVRAKGAAYYALRLLTQEWALPGNAPHGVYSVSTSLGSQNALVTAYALRRPDDTWSVLVVNKDDVARPVTIDFQGLGAFSGPVQTIVFGSEQYGWTGKGPADPPHPDSGLQRATATGSTYVVAPRSVAVIRGTVR